MDKINQLKQWIDDCGKVVFFGGAGVSTESGIPDFRSTDGVYNMKFKYPPETMLSHTFFMNHTEEFFDFYKHKMIYRNALPNITHRKLAELEEKGKVSGVVTQNIDGLHQMAGSENVIELHGSVHRNLCMKCNKMYSLDFILQSQGIPTCSCSGIIKPDVVLYEEALDQEAITAAVNLISNTQVLIIGGTSLSVYPAAGLIEYYKGNKMVLINKEPTSYDKSADISINSSLGEVFKAL